MNLNDFSRNFVTVIFSKDRPLQLDLLLNTLFIHNSCTDAVPYEVVLYKATTEEYKEGYEKIKKRHLGTAFIEETDFKINLLTIIRNKKYVLFLVDDTVFVRKFNPKKICEDLGIFDGAIGFSLRLGENTTYSYPLDALQTMPLAQTLFDDVLFYQWNIRLADDFNYPLELSSSIYRTEDIMIFLKDTIYKNPNDLEWNMASNAHILRYRPYLLVYKTSVAFSNPINKVQTVNNNRVGSNEEFSPKALLEKLKGDFYIDGCQFFNFIPNACHQEVPLTFYKSDGVFRISNYIPEKHILENIQNNEVL